jgi:hypothetical protein
MAPTLKRYARLAAAGAVAVAAGATGLYLLIGWAAMHTPTGGIDQTQWMLTLISVAVPIAALVAAHLVYARILSRYANDE